MKLRSLFEHLQEAAQTPIELPPDRCRICGSHDQVHEDYHLCFQCIGRRQDEVSRIIQDLAQNGPATAVQLSRSSHVPVSVATAYLRGGVDAAMRARAPLPVDEGSPMQVRDHIHRRVEAELEETPAGHR